MRTKRITLIYKLTQKEVIPPAAKEIARKEEWIDAIQKTIEADWKFKLMKVVYELFDPEVQNMVRFFNGTCVKYFAIQDLELTDREPSPEELKMYREELLDEVLGYDFKTVNKVVHTRKSTTDFKTVQAWYTFLETLRETVFEPSGYEFPDSEEFWKLVEKHGHDQAERISVKALQERITKRKV